MNDSALTNVHFHFHLTKRDFNRSALWSEAIVVLT